MKLAELTWTQVNRRTWMSQALKEPNNDSAVIRVLRDHDETTDKVTGYRAIEDGNMMIMKDANDLFEFVAFLASLKPFPDHKKRRAAALDTGS